MYHFCTYFDRNYLAQGLLLYESLKQHSGSFSLYVLCLDNMTFDFLRENHLAGIVPISLQDFERSETRLPEIKKTRTAVEYYFTCTPCLPLYVLQHFVDIDIITYLDADLYFFSDLKPVFDEFSNSSIMIVSHRFPDHRKDLENRGIFNVSWLTFRNSKSGRECLTWWKEKCIEWCFDRIEDGKYADQKYLDDWPSRFKNVRVLAHKGAGIAPWNIDQYQLEISANKVMVDSTPLIFYHFAGLRPLTKYLYNTNLQNYGLRISPFLRKYIYGIYINEFRKIITRHNLRYYNNNFRESRKHFLRKLFGSLISCEVILSAREMNFRIRLSILRFIFHYGILKKLFK